MLTCLFRLPMGEKPHTRNGKCRSDDQQQQGFVFQFFHLLIPASSYRPSSTRAPKCAAGAAENLRARAKKIQKKACQSLACSARGNFERQMSLFCRSKKVQKSEKKA